MKFYLSSYKIGNQIEKLKNLIPSNKKTAYISNALDFAKNEKWVKDFTDFDINLLKNLGLKVETLDLQKYFNNQKKLESDIQKYGIIWVNGGNVFVLRQAMKLSGFDQILQNFNNNNKDILYGGYSAGICILAPNLKGLELVDNPNIFPYNNQTKTIWEGLGILDYMIIPHYQSNHHESDDIEKVVNYCQKHQIPFKPLKDGEVIIINKV